MGLRPADRADRYDFNAAHSDLTLTLLAIDESTVCGFVSFGPSHVADALATGEIFALYVEPAKWGLGIGRRLMVEARTYLRERGFTTAILWVLVGNERALHFYRLDGWVASGEQRSEEVWGVWVDELCFRRDLASEEVRASIGQIESEVQGFADDA